jgi:hypothetical protein
LFWEFSTPAEVKQILSADRLVRQAGNGTSIRQFGSGKASKREAYDMVVSVQSKFAKERERVRAVMERQQELRGKVADQRASFWKAINAARMNGQTIRTQYRFQDDPRTVATLEKALLSSANHGEAMVEPCVPLALLLNKAANKVSFQPKWSAQAQTLCPLPKDAYEHWQSTGKMSRETFRILVTRATAFRSVHAVALDTDRKRSKAPIHLLSEYVDDVMAEYKVPTGPGTKVTLRADAPPFIPTQLTPVGAIEFDEAVLVAQSHPIVSSQEIMAFDSGGEPIEVVRHQVLVPDPSPGADHGVHAYAYESQGRYVGSSVLPRKEVRIIPPDDLPPDFDQAGGPMAILLRHQRPDRWVVPLAAVSARVGKLAVVCCFGVLLTYEEEDPRELMVFPPLKKGEARVTPREPAGARFYVAVDVQDSMRSILSRVFSASDDAMVQRKYGSLSNYLFTEGLYVKVRSALTQQHIPFQEREIGMTSAITAQWDGIVRVPDPHVSPLPTINWPHVFVDTPSSTAYNAFVAGVVSQLDPSQYHAVSSAALILGPMGEICLGKGKCPMATEVSWRLFYDYGRRTKALMVVPSYSKNVRGLEVRRRGGFTFQASTPNATWAYEDMILKWAKHPPTLFGIRLDVAVVARNNLAAVVELSLPLIPASLFWPLPSVPPWYDESVVAAISQTLVNLSLKPTPQNVTFARRRAIAAARHEGVPDHFQDLVVNHSVQKAMIESAETDADVALVVEQLHGTNPWWTPSTIGQGTRKTYDRMSPFRRNIRWILGAAFVGMGIYLWNRGAPQPSSPPTASLSIWDAPSKNVEAVSQWRIWGPLGRMTTWVLDAAAKLVRTTGESIIGLSKWAVRAPTALAEGKDEVTGFFSRLSGSVMSPLSSLWTVAKTGIRAGWEWLMDYVFPHNLGVLNVVVHADHSAQQYIVDGALASFQEPQVEMYAGHPVCLSLPEGVLMSHPQRWKAFTYLFDNPRDLGIATIRVGAEEVIKRIMNFAFAKMMNTDDFGTGGLLFGVAEGIVTGGSVGPRALGHALLSVVDFPTAMVFHSVWNFYAYWNKLAYLAPVYQAISSQLGVPVAWCPSSMALSFPAATPVLLALASFPFRSTLLGGVVCEEAVRALAPWPVTAAIVGYEAWKARTWAYLPTAAVHVACAVLTVTSPLAACCVHLAWNSCVGRRAASVARTWQQPSDLTPAYMDWPSQDAYPDLCLREYNDYCGVHREQSPPGVEPWYTGAAIEMRGYDGPTFQCVSDIDPADYQCKPTRQSRCLAFGLAGYRIFVYRQCGCNQRVSMLKRMFIPCPWRTDEAVFDAVRDEIRGTAQWTDDFADALLRDGRFTETDYFEWVKRFRPATRDTHLEHAGYESNHPVTELMIKAEHTWKIGRPRAIAVPHWDARRLTGPWTHALTKFLAATLKPGRPMGAPMLDKYSYASSCSSEDLGLWFEEHMHPDRLLVEADGRNYDGTLHPEQFEERNRLYLRLGVPARTFAYFGRPQVARIRTFAGIMVVAVLVMLSGRGDTSSGDTIDNFRRAAYVLGPTLVAMLAGGDDALEFVTRTAPLTHYVELCARLGFDYEMQVHEYPYWKATFFSGYFYQCTDQYVHGPKQGRVILKMGWRIVGPDKNDEAWIRGIRMNLLAWDYLPLIAALIERIDRNVGPGRVHFDDYGWDRIRPERPHVLDQGWFGQFLSEAYGVSESDYSEACQAVLETPWGEFFAHPVIDRIVEVDVDKAPFSDGTPFDF